jgi:predicted nucleic acid-binding protein
MNLLVIDASAVLALLLGPIQQGDRVAERIADASLAAPALLPFEVVNVVRRQWSAGLVSDARAQTAWDDFRDLSISLWPWEAIAEGTWALRGSITSYDASYVALARIAGAPLLTADAKLCAAAMKYARIELAAASPGESGS